MVEKRLSRDERSIFLKAAALNHKHPIKRCCADVTLFREERVKGSEMKIVSKIFFKDRSCTVADKF